MRVKRMQLVLIFVSILVELSYQQITIIKSMENEEFRTDLTPSLTQNVSYVRAVDLSAASLLLYSMDSANFAINKYDGRVFLVSRLEPSNSSVEMDRHVQINITNGNETVSMYNRIRVINGHDQSPEILTLNRVFVIEDGASVPHDIKLDNGQVAELAIKSAHPTKNGLYVTCEAVEHFENACHIFSVAKNHLKSSRDYWYGTIQVNQKLNYLKRSVYEFLIVASNERGQEPRTKAQIIVRVVPNFQSAPKISPSSLYFSISEENTPNFKIGEFKLMESYEASLNRPFSFAIVYQPDELLNNGIAKDEVDDVNFDLVRKYLDIKMGNELFVTSTLDRDSDEFKSLDGIFKMWIKTFYDATPHKANYHKITIIIKDLNDNSPRFLTSHNRQLGSLNTNRDWVIRINENEIGPVYLEQSSGGGDQTDSGTFILQDADFGQNATFKIQMNEFTKDIIKYPIRQIIDSITFDPVYMSSDKEYKINSKSTLNIINRKPIDFEELELNPFLDPYTNMASKALKLNLVASETNTAEHLKSEPVPITIIFQDVNDNKPVFSQDTYFAFASESSNDANFLPQPIGQFEVKDKDMGLYGMSGLKCFLMGDGSDLFMVDNAQKKILLKPCTPPCLSNTYKKIYDMALVCKDAQGSGNAGFATVIVNFQKSARSLFDSVPNRIYYVLAGGPSGTEIPALNIRPTIPEFSNKIAYTIQDDHMARLFYVDNEGNFKILTNQLTFAQSFGQNGTFFVPILVSDMSGNLQNVKVILQLSSLLNQVRCPRISEAVDCKYTINRTIFTPNQVRFCPYGADPIVTHSSLNPDPYYNQVFYSLLPESPSYMYINPYDGCVKIMPWFNKDQLSQLVYKIGVYTLAHPDCVYISQKTCEITIDGAKSREIRCPNKLATIENSTIHQVKAYSTDSSSILAYQIVREERNRLGGQFEFIDAADGSTYFSIDSRSGEIRLSGRSNADIDYSSILLVVRVSDMLNENTRSTDCLVEFRMPTQKAQTRSRQHSTQLLRPGFVGGAVRCQDVCEDVPINTLIYSFKAYDPSATWRRLCFSIMPNEYFSLVIDGSVNGNVILKKKLNSGYPQVPPLPNSLNFTGALYYCEQPELLLDKQTITVNILPVNKYPPLLLTQNNRIFISLKENPIKKEIPTLSVVDGDSVYNSFNCMVENDRNFAIINNVQERIVYLTYNAAVRERIHDYLPYVDLTIKCCDDSTKWKENKCFSQPKCSLSLIRVEFTDYNAPIQCIHNELITFVPDNKPINSYIMSAACYSNFSSSPITYKILSDNGLFGINPTQGTIILRNKITICNMESQQIRVMCSNGFSSNVCTYNLYLFPAYNDYRPIWVTPSPFNSTSMIAYVQENAPLGTQIIKAMAVVPDLNATISYAFLQAGLIRNDIYEFEFRSPFSGEIVLKNRLNSSGSTIREMILVATYFRKFNCSFTQYQYLRVVILPSGFYQPCFLTKLRDQRAWPYQVILDESYNRTCFCEQRVQISNPDPRYRTVYYYIVPSNNSNDLVYRNFNINQQTGLICLNQTVTISSVICQIVNSPFSYMDELGNICYNLRIYVSIQSNLDSNRLCYENSAACAFTDFKVCVNRATFYGPHFKTAKSVAVIALDNLFQWETLCLHSFKFLNPKLGSEYNYAINYLSNNTNSLSQFSINKTLDCLTFEFSTCSNRTVLIGKHSLSVRVSDICGRCDTQHISVYILESCRFRAIVTVTSDVRIVQHNLENFKLFFAELSTAILSREIEVVIYRVYQSVEESDSYLSLNQNTYIELAFYDTTYGRFLEDKEIVNKIRVNLKIYQARSLGITNFKSACPQTCYDPFFSYYITIIIIVILLVLLCLLLPLLISGFLCPEFKMLKCRQNKIIMREKCIPIIECTPAVAPTSPVPVCTSTNIVEPCEIQRRPMCHGSMENVRIRTRGLSDSDDARNDAIMMRIHTIGGSMKDVSSSSSSDDVKFRAYSLNRNVDSMVYSSRRFSECYDKNNMVYEPDLDYVVSKNDETLI